MSQCPTPTSLGDHIIKRMKRLDKYGKEETMVINLAEKWGKWLMLQDGK